MAMTGPENRAGARGRGGPKVPSGFTIVEAVLTIVIVAVMLVAALNTAGSSARGRLVRASQHVGPLLARGLLAEVLQARDEDPQGSPVFGPESSESGASRAAFDDVDDYNGWTDSPPTYKDGTGVPNAGGWTRQAAVSYVDPANPGGPAAGTDTGLKRITVTATAPDGRRTVVVGLRSRYGSYEKLPSVRTEYVTWVGAELQIGSSATARVCGATSFVNRVPGGGS